MCRMDCRRARGDTGRPVRLVNGVKLLTFVDVCVLRVTITVSVIGFKIIGCGV